MSSNSLAVPYKTVDIGEENENTNKCCGRPNSACYCLSLKTGVILIGVGESLFCTIGLWKSITKCTKELQGTVRIFCSENANSTDTRGTDKVQNFFEFLLHLLFGFDSSYHIIPAFMVLGAVYKEKIKWLKPFLYLSTLTKIVFGFKASTMIIFVVSSLLLIELGHNPKWTTVLTGGTALVAYFIIILLADMYFHSIIQRYYNELKERNEKIIRECRVGVELAENEESTPSDPLNS